MMRLGAYFSSSHTFVRESYQRLWRNLKEKASLKGTNYVECYFRKEENSWTASCSASFSTELKKSIISMDCLFNISRHHGGSKESKVQHLNQHGQSTVDVMKAKEMSRIKAEITKNMFSPIDSDAIQATAGREMQVKLLQSLGLKLTLMTDGSSLSICLAQHKPSNSLAPLRASDST